MSMKIVVDDCIACGACEPECPNEAISHTDTYVVDASRCVDPSYTNVRTCVTPPRGMSTRVRRLSAS